MTTITRRRVCFWAGACCLGLISGHGLSTDAAAMFEQMPERIRIAAEKLVPLHRPKTAPGPQDWLANHQRTDRRPTISQIESRTAHAASSRRSTCNRSANSRRAQARLTKATADLLRSYYNVRTKVLAPLSLDVIPAKGASHRRHSRTDSHKLRARPGAQTATAKGCRGRARIDDVRPVARRGLEFRFRPSESLGPRRRLVNRPLRQSGKSANERAGLPSHFSRRRPRDGAHAGHPALHRLRVHDERIELIGRSGPRADVAVPRVRAKGLVGVPRRPDQALQVTCRIRQRARPEGRGWLLAEVARALAAGEKGEDPAASHPPLAGNESTNEFARP